MLPLVGSVAASIVHFAKHFCMIKVLCLVSLRNNETPPNRWHNMCTVHKCYCYPAKPLYDISTNFSSCPNTQMDGTTGKRRNWFRKWYVLLYFDENFSRYEESKIRKRHSFTALLGESFLRNIANHAIF